MLNHRIKTENSLILCPDDLENCSFYKSNSNHFFQSGDNSLSSSGCRPSERDSTLEEDLAKLSEELTYEKDRNESLGM